VRYFKRTFLYIIILAAFVGFGYMDFKKTKVDEQKKEEEAKLFKFKPQEVVIVSINKDGKVIEMERWDDGWRMTKPIKTKADGKIIEDFLKQVTTSRNDAEYVMDKNPTDERILEFGLANPTVKVTFKVGREMVPHTILFGNRAPTMGVAYARVEGDKAIYRVLADARSEADKDALYFRDKSVLSVDPLTLDQLSIRRASEHILVKLPENGKWEIVKPKKSRADHARVLELLASLSNAEITAFVEEDKKNLKKYGLDKPAIKLMLWQRNEPDPNIKLFVGNRSPQKRGYFCYMSDRDYIFVLSEEVINVIPVKGKELRSRELIFFEKDNIDRIEVRKRGASIVLLKDSQKEWRNGTVDGAKVDFNLVDEFLGDLMEFKIRDFTTGNLRLMGKYGLDPAKIQLLLWEKGSATPITLSIGKKSPSGRVYAYAGVEKMIVEVDESVMHFIDSYFKEY